MIKIGVSGDAGSFSHEAGLLYAAKIGSSINSSDNHELSYLINMDRVLLALNQGEIDVGVFPFINDNSGIVWPAFIAMGKYNFVPVDELLLNIEQCLLARNGISLDEIRELYSYPPAFLQCQKFIDEYGFKLIDWGDTAKAARDLMSGILPENIGVVASAQAAKHYGLNVIKRGIEDVSPNITRFIVVKKMN